MTHDGELFAKNPGGLAMLLVNFRTVVAVT